MTSALGLLQIPDGFDLLKELMHEAYFPRWPPFGVGSVATFPFLFVIIISIFFFFLFLLAALFRTTTGRPIIGWQLINRPWNGPSKWIEWIQEHPGASRSIQRRGTWSSGWIPSPKTVGISINGGLDRMKLRPNDDSRGDFWILAPNGRWMAIEVRLVFVSRVDGRRNWWKRRG